jgi:hypothetical protein
MASRLGMAEQGSPPEAEHVSPNSYGSETSATSALGKRTNEGDQPQPTKHNGP